MTEPSEAAFQRADEESVKHPSGNYRRALARYIENTSDVAKEIARHGYSDPPTSVDLRGRLQSLILPDEPCKHEVRWMRTEGLTGIIVNGGFKCSKCGTALKIVEAGDD
ncbi:MAG: hypothetical protein E6Q97_05515 [Desulfurellales bacterium]|nr:MAG: hypothetical protein E6Q97_05515 [Desulfurellales bacterium]